MHSAHVQRHPKLIWKTVHVLTYIQHGLTVEEDHRIRGFEFLDGAVFVNRLQIPKKNPPFQAARQALVMIDRHADDDTGQPDSERAVASKSFDTAITKHKGFLDNVFCLGRIACGSNRNLKQKRPMLPSSSVKINVFCSNSDRLHPSMSVIWPATSKGGF